jgi:hypothetical protein
MIISHGERDELQSAEDGNRNRIGHIIAVAQLPGCVTSPAIRCAVDRKPARVNVAGAQDAESYAALDEDWCRDGRSHRGPKLTNQSVAPTGDSAVGIHPAGLIPPGRDMSKLHGANGHTGDATAAVERHGSPGVSGARRPRSHVT